MGQFSFADGPRKFDKAKKLAFVLTGGVPIG
jgi:hypothetical protein